MKDILVDSCLFLWSKCKSHYSRVTSYSTESFKYALQDPNLEKVYSVFVFNVLFAEMIFVLVGAFVIYL